MGRQDQGVQSDFGVSSDPVPVGEKDRVLFSGSSSSGPPGLIISTILENAAASINLFRVLQVRLDIPGPEGCNRTWPRLKALAREYRDFPIYSASQNIINAVSGGLPVLLLTRFFGLPHRRGLRLRHGAS